MANVTIETALQAIRDTYPDLEGWQARAKRPEQPEPRSQLATDDARFRWHPISETARLSLVLAGEHLRLAATAIEARQVYPSAHFTVIRGALMGASQAVWMLAPDEAAERQERGLIVIGEMYQELQKFYNEVGADQLGDEEQRDLHRQIQWCRERIGQVAALRRSGAKLNQTEIIKWAVQHRFREPKRRTAVKLFWRQMSADAHVLGWGLFQRSSPPRPVRQSGIGLAEASGSLEHVAEPFVAAHLLLKEGWSLFDRRCEAPQV